MIAAGQPIDPADFTYPDPVSATGGANALTSGANTWANLPNRVYTSLTVSKRCLVAITFSGYLKVGGSTDVRLAVKGSGATVFAGTGLTDSIYSTLPGGATSYYGHRSMTLYKVIEIGTTTFELQGFRSAAVNAEIPYTNLQIIPIRYV